MTFPNPLSKIYSVIERLDYATGKQHIDVLDTDTSVAHGSVSGTSTLNSVIASITVPPGTRLQIKRVLMTNEGTTAPTTAHFDLYNVSGTQVIEPMGYLSGPGQIERVGTFKDPVTAYANTTPTSVVIALTIAAPTSGNTYTGSIRYSFMDDTRPST